MALRGLEEVGLREALREGLDRLEDVLPFGEADLLVLPARIAEVRGGAGLAHPRDEIRPHARVAAEAAGDEPVARAEELVRDVRMTVAVPPRDRARVDEGDRAVFERRGDGLVHRD